jgi:hypothetical protein
MESMGIRAEEGLFKSIKKTPYMGSEGGADPSTGRPSRGSCWWRKVEGMGLGNSLDCPKGCAKFRVDG